MLHFVLIVYVFVFFSSFLFRCYFLLAFVIRFDASVCEYGSAAPLLSSHLSIHINSGRRSVTVCECVAQSQVVIGLFNYLFIL